MVFRVGLAYAPVRASTKHRLPSRYNAPMERRAMAESLLQDILRAGYHVGSAKVFDRESGDFAYVVDATDTRTGERWTVRGGDRLERKWS